LYQEENFLGDAVQKSKLFYYQNDE